MFYRKIPKNKIYNIALHQGGLGDLIAHLPAIKYILDYHPQVIMELWIHDYAVPLCEKLFKNYPHCVVKGISESKNYDNGRIARSPYAHKVSNLSCHLVDHGFYTIVHTSVEDKHKNYIQMEPIDVTLFSLPKNYIVITTGYTSETRELLPEYANGISEYINSKGYTPVFIGKSNIPTGAQHTITGTFKADYTKGLNLIDKTNLFEAHAIMAGAACVVGLDNGLCHLAGMSRVPIVMGFTTVEPRHRLPYRNDQLGWNCYIIKPNNLDCFGCQSNWNFADTTIDFKYCLHKDYLCVKGMTTDLWIEQLEKIL